MNGHFSARGIAPFFQPKKNQDVSDSSENPKRRCRRPELFFFTHQRSPRTIFFRRTPDLHFSVFFISRNFFWAGIFKTGNLNAHISIKMFTSNEDLTLSLSVKPQSSRKVFLEWMVT